MGRVVVLASLLSLSYGGEAGDSFVLDWGDEGSIVCGNKFLEFVFGRCHDDNDAAAATTSHGDCHGSGQWNFVLGCGS